MEVVDVMVVAFLQRKKKRGVGGGGGARVAGNGARQRVGDADNEG